MAINKWAAAGGAGLILAVGVGAYMATATGFDSGGWKAQRSSAARENPRAKMVVGLKDALKPGMSRDEVVRLLGEPETTEQGRFVYAIGASAFGVDYEYVVVEFDEGGRLVRHSIRRG